jgi:hypothetical protein
VKSFEIHVWVLALPTCVQVDGIRVELVAVKTTHSVTVRKNAIPPTKKRNEMKEETNTSIFPKSRAKPAITKG